MELIERAGFLDILQEQLNTVSAGEGHCVFISGEAGIGKSSLIKTFFKELKGRTNIYQGTCDALFTPRPLAPLYDILVELGSDFSEGNIDTIDRTTLFSRFFQELKNKNETSIVIFEDIHWADEATLDFIKFFARRITQLPCLFILTYRDNEIYTGHPLRNILGQLSPDSFTRMQLPPLSREAVEKMSEERGYNGEEVYHISGGNPFYVNEILASYSPGVPDNIKDSVLALYNGRNENTKRMWAILSVMPAPFETVYFKQLEPGYAEAIQGCVDSKILIIEKERIFFKHELFRRTIEDSLSPLVRVDLNRQILDMLLESFERDQKVERIIHHAKNANEYELVAKHAPVAAKKAALVGSHIEATRLYLSAIEYYQGNDENILIDFYESYAYECYLTNQIKEAIIYTGKALEIWKKKNNKEKVGNCMRFLSRLWWFDGNRKQAENYGMQAIDVLEELPSSKAKAMAYSNMSQLKMLSDEHSECILWGEKAIAMAKELNDEETLSHALNNVGDVQLRVVSTRENGIKLLQQSLDIALKNSFHEHVARAYTNIGYNAMLIKDYQLAKKMLEEGIQYCEERDLDSWTIYMLADKAKLQLEMGEWDEADKTAGKLMKNETMPPVSMIGVLTVLATIKMRRGNEDVLPILIEAKEKAIATMELQRIIPALVALLEYEWLTGNKIIENETLNNTIAMIGKMGNVYENSEFVYWLQKARKQTIPFAELYEGYEIKNKSTALKAAALWDRLKCPYEQALALFEAGDDDKRKAVSIMHSLGAEAVTEKMKFEMRNAGIKSIPRGARKTTLANPSFLTGRELDVLQLLQEGLQNKEIAGRLFISAKTVDHHISSILYKLEVNSRAKAVQEAIRQEIIK